MNKLAKASLIANRTLRFQNDTVFREFSLPYPILKVLKCHYECKVAKIGDYAQAEYDIKATLVVADSRDNVPFEKKIAFVENFDILNEEDNAGEGFIVSESEIDLDELAFRAICSFLPIRLTRPDSPLPESGKGYRVLSEEEKQKETAEKPNPAFAALDNFKVEK